MQLWINNVYNSGDQRNQIDLYVTECVRSKQSGELVAGICDHVSPEQWETEIKLLWKEKKKIWQHRGSYSLAAKTNQW